MQVERVGNGLDLFDNVTQGEKPVLKPYSEQRCKELAKEFFSIKTVKGVTCSVDLEILQPGKVTCHYEPKKGISFGKIIGLIEGIPILGTPVAIISFVGHLVGMAINKREESLGLEKCNTINAKPELSHIDLSVAEEQWCNAKLSYAQNARQMRASALSIIPFVKPIIRSLQLGWAYYKQPENVDKNRQLDQAEVDL